VFVISPQRQRQKKRGKRDIGSMAKRGMASMQAKAAKKSWRKPWLATKHRKVISGDSKHRNQHRRNNQ